MKALFWSLFIPSICCNYYHTLSELSIIDPTSNQNVTGCSSNEYNHHDQNEFDVEALDHQRYE